MLKYGVMMPDPVYTLDAASIRVLRKLVHEEMLRVKSRLWFERERHFSQQGFRRMHWGIAIGAIDAGSGDTPGSGTVALEWFDVNGVSDLEYITDASNTIAVRNMHGEIPDETRVLVQQDTAGVFWVQHGLKPLVRFTLAASLATTDASKSATISNQYGFGSPSPLTGSGEITVHNLLTSTASTYVFSGASGKAGLAMWDSGEDYRIIQMQCG